MGFRGPAAGGPSLQNGGCNIATENRFWVGNLGSGMGESSEYLQKGVQSCGGLLGTECPSLFHGQGIEVGPRVVTCGPSGGT